MKPAAPWLLAALVVLAPRRPPLAVPPQPIPEGPDAGALPVFSGRPATPHPVAVPDPPRHPFMAPNGRSNLHVDALPVRRPPGPGPARPRRWSALDVPRGRVRVGDLRLARADRDRVRRRSRARSCCCSTRARSTTLAVMPLPPRACRAAATSFTDFAGGGYFYLDDRDRAVIPTTTRPRLRRRARPAAARLRARARLRPHRPRSLARRQDHLRAARLGRPDLVRVHQRRGRHDRPGDRRRPARGRWASRSRNSFAVDEHRRRLHRHRRGAVPVRRRRDRRAARSPGARPTRTRASASRARPSAGSGTTPTLMGARLRRDHRQRRPDERRRLPPRQAVERPAPGLPPARCSRRARARPTSR